MTVNTDWGTLAQIQDYCMLLFVKFLSCTCEIILLSYEHKALIMENADFGFILFLLSNDAVFFFSSWYVSNYVPLDCIMLEYSDFMHLFACFLILLYMYAVFAHMCVSMHV